MVRPLLQTTPGGRGRRTRQLPDPLTTLPALSSAQQTLLLKWLKSDAQERSWQSLLHAAGSSQLEVADALLQALLLCGAVALKEELHHGQWRPWRVVWTDLESLQALAGVPTRNQREADKVKLNRDLQALAQTQPWLSAAVHSLLSDVVTAASKTARAELLQALVVWQQAQRQGMRQDFALAARGHTKAISTTEWDWLEATVPLETLGIGRFEPLIWLAGTMALCSAADSHGPQASWAALGFVGLPCRSLDAPLRVVQPPQKYWLIENRASFERQATRLPPGTCLVWLPGRPSSAWLQAMRCLLTLAPAPADVSCDPDPAGIQIALTAGALWDAAGIGWQAAHMASEIWRAGTTLPLNDYDRRVLAELQATPGLPPGLASLRDDLISSGTKAEQEGWL